MKRILFAAAERHILGGLRNRLRPLRDKWAMRFVDSGPSALEAMAREPFDVVFTDRRMPHMNGADLLRVVQQTYPDVARLVLSGYADEQSMVCARSVAHQLLSKPCAPGELEDVIERTSSLQSILNDERVKHVVGSLNSLPPRPAVYLSLMAALSNERVSAETIARLLKSDPSLCEKVLQVVNSGGYQFNHRVVSVDEAVGLVGLGAIRQLLLIGEVFTQARARNRLSEASLAAMQRHALLTGGIASSLVDTPAEREVAFVAALLHDVGELLIGAELPERAEALAAEMKVSRCSMHVAEKRLYGVTHAELGAYLLRLWQMPFPVIEAVANHHEPERLGPAAGGLNAATAVHIADVLAYESGFPRVENGESPPCLDASLMSRLGLSGRLEQWRRSARQKAKAFCDFAALGPSAWPSPRGANAHQRLQ